MMDSLNTKMFTKQLWLIHATQNCNGINSIEKIALEERPAAIIVVKYVYEKT